MLSVLENEYRKAIGIERCEYPSGHQVEARPQVGNVNEPVFEAIVVIGQEWGEEVRRARYKEDAEQSLDQIERIRRDIAHHDLSLQIVGH